MDQVQTRYHLELRVEGRDRIMMPGRTFYKKVKCLCFEVYRREDRRKYDDDDDQVYRKEMGRKDEKKGIYTQDAVITLVE